MNDSMNEVFAAMGSALTRWSMADRCLTEIYAVAVNPKKPQMAAASIWKVTSHNTKIEMTEAALETMFLEYSSADPEPVRTSWRAAKKKMSKAIKGRNDLGHSSLYMSANGKSRVSVLQKDRDKFHARMRGTKLATEFTEADCYKIETASFDANHAAIRVLIALDEFYRSVRIVMRHNDASPEEPFLESRRRRRALKT